MEVAMAREAEKSQVQVLLLRSWNGQAATGYGGISTPDEQHIAPLIKFGVLSQYDVG
jgi:hypothetical protein